MQLKDIVANMRNYADRLEASGGYPSPEDLRTFAGGIEHAVEELKPVPCNAAVMRKALQQALYFLRHHHMGAVYAPDGETLVYCEDVAKVVDAALAAQPHKGRWKNGRSYEYEYAYCSECGRMQWAGWDTHEEAEENIESFADDYRFCPGCGAEMEGGEYVK